MSKIKPKAVAQPLYNLLPTNLKGFDWLAELALDSALFVESCHRPSVAKARSETVGTHP